MTRKPVIFAAIAAVLVACAVAVGIIIFHKVKRVVCRIRPRDIEPGDIKRLLPYISISDVIAEPFDLRYRLGGTAVVETSGYDFTGRFLHEMPVTTGMEQR